MTDKEKAVEYADWFWGASPSEQRAIEQAYLDGLEEGRKEKWHDLRKNPNDLPKERGDYWVKYDDASEERGDFYDVHYFEPDKSFYKKHWSEIDVIAWCELPKYEE